MKHLMTISSFVVFSIIAVASSGDKSSESSEDITNSEYVCPIHNTQMVDDGFGSYRCQKCYPDPSKMPFFE